MRTKSITFIFPSPRQVPGGGPKVVYEYANRLASEGWSVKIAYAWHMRKEVFIRGVNPIRSLLGYIRYNIPYVINRNLKRLPSCRKWFNLDARVEEVYPHTLDYAEMPRTDFYVATACSTAPFVRDYPVNNKHKLYLIQDYETWNGRTDAEVRETYHYGLQNIAVSRWLRDLVEEEGAECALLLNGFDFTYFSQYVPFEEKDKMACSALYGEGRKGSVYAIEACEIVRRKYPKFRLIFFGVNSKPKNLPEWVEYYQSPNKELLNKIYNEPAIFVGSSLQEGWGLPVGESMICGAAVVCTDTLGYKEMVKDGETGLICPIRDSNALANNIIRLIEDDQLRLRIAKLANSRIQSYTWDNSFEKLKEILSVD